MSSSSRFTLPPHVVRVLWGVRPEFLQAAFDEIDARYGGVEAYLREGLAIGEPERARLRELYLQPGKR